MRPESHYYFEWDPVKARENLRKHRVSFELAATVFRDPKQLTLFDGEHGDEEDRWVTLGIAGNGVPLVIAHTFHELSGREVTIRIISARKATNAEAYQSERGLR